MRWHNAGKQTMRFVLGGTAYVVPPGANITIPEKFGYAVRSHGLLLTEGELPGAPEGTSNHHAPKQPPLPPGIEMGPIKKRAREENEDLDAGGDGDPIEGDDMPADMGAEASENEDPVEKTARALEAKGVDIVGSRKRRR